MLQQTTMQSGSNRVFDALDVDDETDKRLEQGTLSFDDSALLGLRSRSSAHILKSLASAKLKRSNTAPGSSFANAGEGSSNVQLKFEVVSARTIDQENEKKHVAYTVLVRKDGLLPDPNPAVIERRYSDFLTLYESLRREYPALMSTIAFPKKALLGNFAPGIITLRSAGFEALLEYVSADEKLKDSPSLTTFLQGRERDEARHWLRAQQYPQAFPLLENTFRLLNKFYTDRHPAVLLSLCHLVACASTDPKFFAAERFSDLALRRFEAVSDADLLQFYVPLLQLCVHLWWQLDRDRTAIEARLESLKRRGIRVDGAPTLLDALMALD